MNLRRPRIRTLVLLLGVLFFGLVYWANTSHRAAPLGSGPFLIAHRALGQVYDRDGLDTETCTAARMIEGDHAFLENTIPSIRAAFDFGADVVEIDVHRTTDGRFAVFHDWTLDCRTDGLGRTRDHSLEELQRLDMGYGYTADGGQSFPFRGRGVGMLPSLAQVLQTFPTQSFLIDIKSGDPEEGRMLADQLAALPMEQRQRLMVTGGGAPVRIIRDRFPQVRTIWRNRLKACMVRYALYGWTGRVPAACERSLVLVPVNYAGWLWGWPNRFLQRMDAVGSKVVLLGDYDGEGFSSPFDDPSRLGELPVDYSGGLWTDRIDRMAPAVQQHFDGVGSDRPR